MASRVMKVFVIAMFGGSLLMSGTAAKAAERTVCPSGCGYSCIQAAVSACGEGDVVTVGPGTYQESVLFGPGTPS